MAAAPPTRTFHGFDALRGVAAVSVLLYHLAGSLGTPWLAPSGYLAVDLFFLMSGFVVAHAYEQKIPQLGVAGFMRVRLARLLPLFYLGGALGLARLGILLVLGKSDVSPVGALAYFLFVPAPGAGLAAVSPLNIPAWSLLLEIYINLLYAALLPRLSTKLLVCVVILSGLGLLVTAILDVNLSGGAVLGTWWVGALRVCFSFPLGVVMYRKRAWPPRGDWSKWLLLAAFCAAVSVPSSPLWDAAFIIVLSPGLALFALRCNASDRVSDYGARASYGIYAIHWPIIVVTGAVARRLGFNVTVVLLAAPVAILIAAPLLDRFFDRPLRKRLNALRFGQRAVTESA